jgi:hypothetical protein
MNDKEIMLIEASGLLIMVITLIIINFLYKGRINKLDSKLIAKSKQYDSLIDTYRKDTIVFTDATEKLRTDCAMKVKEERRLANDSEQLIRSFYKEEIDTLKQVIKALEKDLSENYKVISNLNKQLRNQI